MDSELRVGGVPIVTESTFSDYPEVVGLQFPFVTVSSNQYIGKVETKVTKSSVLKELDQTVFAKE